jgi:allantoicase
MPRTLPLPKGNEKVWLELLPREHLRKHGRHVYMFRNTQTNQILYTLYPRIEV